MKWTEQFLFMHITGEEGNRERENEYLRALGSIYPYCTGVYLSVPCWQQEGRISWMFERAINVISGLDLELTFLRRLWPDPHGTEHYALARKLVFDSGYYTAAIEHLRQDEMDISCCCRFGLECEPYDKSNNPVAQLFRGGLSHTQFERLCDACRDAVELCGTVDAVYPYLHSNRTAFSWAMSILGNRHVSGGKTFWHTDTSAEVKYKSPEDWPKPVLNVWGTAVSLQQETNKDRMKYLTLEQAAALEPPAAWADCKEQYIFAEKDELAEVMWAMRGYE